jgi:hypothetical protein
MDTNTLFGCSYQHGLSVVVQYFSLKTKQPQPAYKPQKQPAEQGEIRYPVQRTGIYLVNRKKDDNMYVN